MTFSKDDAFEFSIDSMVVRIVSTTVGMPISLLADGFATFCLFHGMAILVIFHGECDGIVRDADDVIAVVNVNYQYISRDAGGSNDCGGEEEIFLGCSGRGSGSANSDNATLAAMASALARRMIIHCLACYLLDSLVRYHSRVIDFFVLSP